MEKVQGDLIVKVEGLTENLSAEPLLDMLRNMIKLLEMLHRTGEEWEISSIRMASPLLIGLVNPALGFMKPNKNPVTKLVQSIRRLERNADLSVGFKRNHQETLLKVLEPVRSQAFKLSLTNPNDKRSADPVVATVKSVRNLEHTLFADRYTDIGTIEGKFDGMIAHNKINLFIWEELEDRKIRCVINPELFEKYKNLFQQRVAVAGEITYNRQGVPISIAVETIHEINEPDRINFSKFKGIRLTKTKPENFVREMRNAQ